MFKRLAKLRPASATRRAGDGSHLLLLVIAVLVYWPFTLPAQQDGSAAARIVLARGAVQVLIAATGTTLPARPGQSLRPGDVVSTGANGTTALLMADETLIQLNRNTRFTLRQVVQRSAWARLRGLIPAADVRGKSVYELLTGELWLLNKNRDADLEVVTPTVTAAVRGTEFNLAVDAEERAELTVLEGTIRAFNDFGAVEAMPGEQVVAVPGAAPAKRLLAQPEDAVQWIVKVPPFFGARDFPLVSSDAALLDAERGKLEGASDRESLVRLASVLRDQGLTEQAKSLFERLLEGDSAYAPARAGLGWCLLDLGQPRESLDAFGGVELVEAAAGRVAALIQLDRLAEAERELDRAQARAADNRRFELQRALVELLSGRIRQAHARLREFTATKGDNALGWQMLALSAVLINEKAAAIEAAARAMSLNPGSATARIVQAYAYQSIFDLGSAAAALEVATELDGKSVTALVNLAEIRFGSDRIDEAEALLERAGNIAPADSRVLNLRGFLHLARREDLAAIDAFERAAGYDPGLADARLGLGIARMRRGDVASAFESVTTALALEPRRALFYTYWGKMLYQVERFDKALDVLERASVLDPRDPTPVFLKSIILRDLNRPGEAIRALNHAVALNDNRAVYRSRYLLDRDLAVKNVDLSILYSRLGLNAWARKKAVSAIKSDYLNYAGHLFYAGALAEEEDRAFAFGAEALLARLLQPANVNTFNTFNDYTSFFERPSADAQLTVAAGNNAKREGELIAFGSLPEANLAFQAGLFHEGTDGWRGTDFDRTSSGAAILKWEATPRDGVMVAASRTALRQGDDDFPRFEFDAPSSPDDRLDSNVSRVEVGYHHHFGPDADLIAYVARLWSDGRTLSNAATPITGLPGFRFLEVNDVEFDKPYYQAQVQHMQRLGDHSLIFGTLQYRADNEADVSDQLFLQGPGVDVLLPPPFSTQVQNFLDVRFQSYYLQDTWTVSPSVIIEGALYYDHIENSNAVAGTRWELRKWNPRAGVIWSPTDRDTFRLGAFRYLLPFASARVDPTEVAGITISRNVEEGAVIRETDFTWEHEWNSGLLSTNVFYLKKSFTDAIVTGGVQQLRKREGRRKGIEFEVNQLLYDRIGLSARYRFIDTADETLPQYDREEHLGVLGLRYIRPDGLSAGVEQIYRRLNLNSPRSDEHIWNTDLELAYELPRKTGSVKLEIHNVFDQEYNWVTDRFVLEGQVPDREVLFTVSLNF